jgi:hypothetical protein
MAFFRAGIPELARRHEDHAVGRPDGVGERVHTAESRSSSECGVVMRNS